MTPLELYDQSQGKPASCCAFSFLFFLLPHCSLSVEQSLKIFSIGQEKALLLQKTKAVLKSPEARCHDKLSTPSAGSGAAGNGKVKPGIVWIKLGSLKLENGVGFVSQRLLGRESRHLVSRHAV